MSVIFAWSCVGLLLGFGVGFILGFIGGALAAPDKGN